MSVAQDFMVSRQDVDPRGLPVAGHDGMIAGTVHDIWVDVGEQMIRYLEVEVTAGEAPAEGAAPRRVLVPDGAGEAERVAPADRGQRGQLRNTSPARR